MSANWIKEQPSNRNFLNPIGFLLKLEKFDGVDFFCQSANVPDVTMPTTEVASPFRNLPIIPGGGVTFGDFTVRFIVDEDLKNYKEIFEWITSIGNYENDSKIIAGAQTRHFFSDAAVIITNSAYRPKQRILFKNTYPISLSQINFSSLLNDSEPVVATVQLNFETLAFEDVDD